MNDNFIQTQGLCKHFAGVRALENVSMDIRRGEIHCLCGENGSGKSTLIKVLSGVYKPDGGTVTIEDKTYSHLEPNESIAAGIQVIYQDFSIFPNLTVAENIALNEGLRNNRKIVNWKRIQQIATEALDILGVQINLDDRLEDLSVANKQLVAIARAIINDAKLIVMDEPTTALTDKEVRALFALIKKMQAKGMSILFVSHKLEEVFEIADRFTILRSGEKIITIDKNELTRERFLYYMTGRSFEETPFTADTRGSEPIFEVKNLSLANGYKDINFKLYPGEILCITGLLGSGRTELALSLFGDLKPDSGEIYLNGEKTVFKSIMDAIDKGVGYVPEDRLTEGLFLTQSIERNLGILDADKSTSRFARVDYAHMHDYAMACIDQFGIVVGKAEDKMSTLSGGNQQKCVLARWIAGEPKMLVLNGPTVGVDIASKFDIFKTLRAKAQEGLGIIVISDDVSEIITNCSRILIMRYGRIRGEYAGGTLDAQQLSELLTADELTEEGERANENV